MVSTSSSPNRGSSARSFNQKRASDDGKVDKVAAVVPSDDEESPQPVSSDEEKAAASTKQVPQRTESSSSPATGMSRLFAPYRTVGVVSSAHPFALIPHQSSQSSMLCVPTGERFQLWQTDKLQPVLVSQAVPSVAKRSTGRRRDTTNALSKLHHITHCVPDATLRATLVAHGSSSNSRHVTLYQRTTPVATLALAARGDKNKFWKVQDMLHLGRTKVNMTGEKQGKTENGALVAVVLARDMASGTDNDDEMDHAAVPMVGKDDDDSSESSDSSSNDSESDDDEDDGAHMGQLVLLIATRSTLQIHRRIRLRDMPTFYPMTAVHPATYVNKIVLAGTDQGRPAMCLLNVRTCKLIHIFTSCFPASTSLPPCSITVVEQSPAIDTIAVGTDQGLVHLINLRHDKKLFTLKHKGLDGKPVTITSISFRDDGSAMKYGIAPMAVGRSDGTITIWDLTPPEDKGAGRTILSELVRVHPGGVSKLQYMPQEPLLVSTGTQSNSILMHIFDNPDHSGRVLRQRKGHTAPPCRISYLHPGAGAGGGVLANTSDGTDASACQILSSGGPDRTLRVFSTARTVLDKEYSQGRGLEKRAKKLGLESKSELLLPPLTDMALCEARSRDWGDLVTIHHHHSFAYVWSTRRGAQVGPVLRQPQWNVSNMKAQPPADTHATCVAMSACGNFALVGTRGGIIYKYNVQSGNPRGSYPRDASEQNEDKKTKSGAIGDVHRTTKALEKDLKVKNVRASNLDKRAADLQTDAKREKMRRAKLLLASHTGFAVTGMAVDAINKTVVSVGADSKLVLWNFSTHAPHKKSPCRLPSPATKLSHVRDSDLAAIALEDFSVILFDCSALAIVRRFGSGSVCHQGPISDLGFSPDGRNLLTSSIDGTIRVWDVPTNTCIDWLRFKAPPTSLSVSPTGEFLATTHLGKIGISIWSDRSYYQRVHTSGVNLEQPISMDDPVPIAETWQPVGSLKEAPVADTRDEIDQTDNLVDAPVSAKEDGLITLSGLPIAHWKNLFHLELVKERNKPKEAPKKPPSAPFFLQWRSGEPIADEKSGQAGEDSKQVGEDEWASAWSDDDETKTEVVDASPIESESNLKREEESHAALVPKKRRKIVHHRSHLASLLVKCGGDSGGRENRRFQEVSDHITELGPSAIDVAFSNLCNGMHDLEEGLPLLLLASQWLLEACKSHERHEAVNAYLHRFLFLHSSVIAGIDVTTSRMKDKSNRETTNEIEGRQREYKQRQDLLMTVGQLRQAHSEASDLLRSKLQHSLCLLRHFSRMT